MRAALVILAALGPLVAVACGHPNGDVVSDDAGTEAIDPDDVGGAAARKDGGTRRTSKRDAAAGEPEEARFATKVVSFTPGACSGFGQVEMPNVVLGPPKGKGDSEGSLDVVSLGKGGEIVLSFDTAIVDKPGVDFIVFENAFYANGNPAQPYFELGEVSVSEDGETWTTFPCTATAAPYGTCAGWHPVYATPESEIVDPEESGGDPFDLAAIGVTRARFVRIKDKTTQRCTSQGPDTNGFDLDAIAALHTEDP